MPRKTTVERAKKDAREGKAPTTQAGEFVREEMEHIREGKHGARSPKQAIAIGLSKARRAGVKLPAPRKGTTSKRTRTQAKRDLAKGERGASARRPSRTRSRATSKALKREGRSAASPKALAKQARSAAAARKRRGAVTPSTRTTRTARSGGGGARKTAAKKSSSRRGVRTGVHASA